MLGSYLDANTFLDQGKLVFTSDADALPYMTEAGRTIRGYLYGRVDAATMTAWDSTPNGATAPELIRSIAGRLAAARVYFSKYSGEAEEVTPYAQMLWNQGIAALNGIMNGTLVIDAMVDAGQDIVTEQHLDESMFYPNDSGPSTDDPKFTMGTML